MPILHPHLYCTYTISVCRVEAIYCPASAHCIGLLNGCPLAYSSCQWISQYSDMNHWLVVMMIKWRNRSRCSLASRLVWCHPRHDWFTIIPPWLLHRHKPLKNYDRFTGDMNHGLVDMVWLSKNYDCFSDMIESRSWVSPTWRIHCHDRPVLLLHRTTASTTTTSWLLFHRHDGFTWQK